MTKKLLSVPHIRLLVYGTEYGKEDTVELLIGKYFIICSFKVRERLLMPRFDSSG